MKQNTKNHNHSIQRGFTIVELLIVVIIIAILAAITIVAYNGIQARANNSSALATANTLSRKINAYYALKGSYPVSTTKAALVTELAAYAESTLPSSGINIHTTAVPMNAASGDNTVKVAVCTGGVRITPWDYLKATPGDSASPITLGTTTTCTLITT